MADLRRARVEDAFFYDAIEAIVAWNDPDDEHTRFQLRGHLDDLIENAIRERDEAKPADPEPYLPTPEEWNDSIGAPDPEGGAG